MAGFGFIKDNTHFTLITHPSSMAEFYAKYFSHGVCHKSFELYQPGMYFLSEAKDQSILIKMRQDFGIYSGVTIVEKNNEYCDMYSFCSTKVNQDIAYYIRHREILDNFIRYVKEKSPAVLRNAEQDRWLLPKIPKQIKPEDSPFVSEVSKNFLVSMNMLLTQ